MFKFLCLNVRIHWLFGIGSGFVFFLTNHRRCKFRNLLVQLDLLHTME